jgi:hypothetical protein
MLEGQIYTQRLRAAQLHFNSEELGGFIVPRPPRPWEPGVFAKETLIPLRIPKTEWLGERHAYKMYYLQSSQGQAQVQNSRKFLDMSPVLR